MKKILICALVLSSCSFSPATLDQSTLPDDVETAVSSHSSDWEVEVYAQNLSIPWTLLFTDSDRLLVAERSGAIRQIIDGEVSDPLISLEVASSAEEGLMGMALDPNYQTNNYLYVCYAQISDNAMEAVVARLRDEGDVIDFDKLLLNNIPAARFHAGCALAVGPDEKLYVTTGDAIDKNIAQDLQSLGGKILRMNLNGTIPADNPFPSSYVYSFGHRNPQGIAWHEESGSLYSSEHGPSGFDGPAGGDEVNMIQPGGNYGWPIISHSSTQEGLKSPLLEFTPAIAPGSLHYYDSEVLPAFTDSFLMGLLKGEDIGVFRVSSELDGQPLGYDSLGLDVGRIRPIVTGPDGFIYFGTSNTDGRGTQRAGDDVIYRIIPKDD